MPPLAALSTSPLAKYVAFTPIGVAISDCKPRQLATSRNPRKAHHGHTRDPLGGRAPRQPTHGAGRIMVCLPPFGWWGREDAPKLTMYDTGN